jgi:leader peptidase (prepilin peptidase)/N-methyltransferase
MISNGAFLIALGCLIGLVLGSFVTTAAIRTVAGIQWVSGRSHCDHCSVQLDALQTVPVLGFIMLGGRCSSCGGNISSVHLLGEISGAIIAVGAILAPTTSERFWLLSVGLVLLYAAVLDWGTRKIPNEINLLILILSLVLSLVQRTQF